MKVVHVNTTDQGGGAERVALALHQGLRRQGHDSWLLVGAKHTADPHVLSFYESPHIDYRPYARWGRPALRGWLKQRDRARGREDFRFPFSRRVLELTGSKPDVVHCHNLHGGFFDLRILPWLCRQIPVFLTLHDCWLMTGHCAYPFECARWQTGCGACPHLETPPALAYDGTRENWQRKAKLYARCQLHVSTGSDWLLRRAEQSMLAPALAAARTIPYGVDLNVFRPGSRAAARRQLGIPADVYVLVFVANRARSNPFKDYATLHAALCRLAGGVADSDVHFYVIGEEAAIERHGRLHIHHVAYEKAPAQIARYYQAADLYAHAARDEVLGIVLTEAMACGTPVVATRVGGIPEAFVDGVHGMLVPPADPVCMAEAVARLLRDPALRQHMGQEAAAYARQRYDQETMIRSYQDWYAESLPVRRSAA